MKKYLKLFLKIFICILIITSIIIIKLNYSPCDEVIQTTSFDSINISARSAVVIESSTGRILFEKDSNLRLLTASIAKILTCIIAIENIDLDRLVVIDEVVLQATGSSLYLKIGDVYQISDLLYGIMLQSGNDASLVVAKSYSGEIKDFIYKMNELAKKLGMHQSSFENPTGLDETTKNYSSAYDMSILMAYCMKNELFRKITSTKNYRFENVDGHYYLYSNKHRLIKENEDVIGGKTGYTKKAGRTLVSVFKRNKMEIIITTFDASNDWQLHRSLADKAYQLYEMELILTPFTFHMSTLGVLGQRELLEAVYYPLKKGEEVDLIIYLSDHDCYLKVNQRGRTLTKFLLNVRSKYD